MGTNTEWLCTPQLRFILRESVRGRDLETVHRKILQQLFREYVYSNGNPTGREEWRDVELVTDAV